MIEFLWRRRYLRGIWVFGKRVAHLERSLCRVWDPRQVPGDGVRCCLARPKKPLRLTVSGGAGRKVFIKNVDSNCAVYGYRFVKPTERKATRGPPPARRRSHPGDQDRLLTPLLSPTGFFTFYNTCITDSNQSAWSLRKPLTYLKYLFISMQQTNALKSSHYSCKHRP